MFIKRSTALITGAICSSSSFLVGYLYSKKSNTMLDEFRSCFVVNAASSGDVSLPLDVFSNIQPQPILTPKVSQSSTSAMTKYGLPSFDNLRSFEHYMLSYDRRNRVPNWVLEYLTPSSIEKNPDVDRSKSDFKEDPQVHQYFRSFNADYKKSGFDRGHMAAAGNHRTSQAAVDETFFLSNMAPQVGKGFNRDKWNELEHHTRRLARKSNGLYVITGPLYLPKKEGDGKMYVRYQVIGNSHVAVPTHFFKVLLANQSSGLHLESYVLPNQPIPDEMSLKNFLIPLESIERAAGLLMFQKLPPGQIKSVNRPDIKPMPMRAIAAS